MAMALQRAGPSVSAGRRSCRAVAPRAAPGERLAPTRATIAAAEGSTLYAVLGVASTASGAEIKAAWRRLARLHHPDAGGQAAAFLRCRLAYELLSDGAARREYDALRAGGGGGAHAHASGLQQQQQERWWHPGAGGQPPPDAAAAAAAAAGGGSSGLAAGALAAWRGGELAAVRAAGGSASAGAARHGRAALRAALLERHALVLESFGSMQEALELLEQLDGQALRGLAAEDYGEDGGAAACGGGSSTGAAGAGGTGRPPQRWGAWHPGAFVPGAQQQQQHRQQQQQQRRGAASPDALW
ncbi:DJA6 [Scenedesmus sp. PABB004]|nr:DJA6 [Scenedesmus sp. PABB004]